jgi:hypothetical protein
MAAVSMPLNVSANLLSTLGTLIVSRPLISETTNSGTVLSSNYSSSPQTFYADISWSIDHLALATGADLEPGATREIATDHIQVACKNLALDIEGSVTVVDDENAESAVGITLSPPASVASTQQLNSSSSPTFTVPNSVLATLPSNSYAIVALLPRSFYTDYANLLVNQDEETDVEEEVATVRPW